MKRATHPEPKLLIRGSARTSIITCESIHLRLINPQYWNVRQKMKRILVTGNAGSGKSTFARRVAAELALPMHGLDCVVWQPGWKKTPPAERAALITKLVDQESWVIDGVSFDVQARADTIVFLDIPRRISFLRVMKRNWRYLFRSRPDLPANCPEILIVSTLFKIIWNFPKNIRPRILEHCSESQRFFHVRNSSDLAACIDALNAGEAQQQQVAEPR